MESIELLNTIQVCGSKSFNEHLRNALDHVLTPEFHYSEFKEVFKRSLVFKQPKRVFVFLSEIIKSLSDSNVYANDLTTLLINASRSKSILVRKNCLRFICYLPVELEHIAIVSERLFDKEPSIRVIAIEALRKYQGVALNGKNRLECVFKNVLRHDCSANVRYSALEHISYNTSTYAAVISRAIDKEWRIRKLFYLKSYKMLNFLELSESNIKDLIFHIFSARDFDVKTEFISIIFKELDLQVNINRLLAYIDGNVKSEFLSYVFRIIDAEFIEANIQGLLFKTEEELELACQYLKYKEANYGRESLLLPDITLFVEYFYQICASNISANGLNHVFDLLHFYDFFSDESVKFIKHAVIKIIDHRTDGETASIIFDKSIALLNTIPDNIQVLKKVINNVCNHAHSLTLVTRAIMKNIRPFSDVHTALVEAMIDSKKCDYLTLYYYGVYSYDSRIDKLLVESNDLLMICDLYLTKNNSYFQDVLFLALRSEPDEIITIPIYIKVILSGKVEDTHDWELLIMKTYYKTSNDMLKQLIFTFFHEFLPKSPITIQNCFVEVFACVSEKLIFIDQMIYFLEMGCSSKCCYGEILYALCIYSYLECVNCVKYQMYLVNYCTFSSNALKKALYCLNISVKKFKHAGMGELIGSVMSVDDGEPISIEDLTSVKLDMNILNP